jgi:hypothetical protein
MLLSSQSLANCLAGLIPTLTSLKIVLSRSMFKRVPAVAVLVIDSCQEYIIALILNSMPLIYG